VTADWRLLVGPGLPGADAIESDGARNMAVDQVLFDSVKAGSPPVVRFFRWSPACLSLGRNQPARGRYDREGRVPGRDIVRRPTGGLAVVHDQELTYSVACAVGALGSPRTTYLRVHRAIARGLAALGVPAVVDAGGGKRTPPPSDPLGVCFAAPAPGEILAAAGKLVGSAQRTEARTILQHGSILLDGSQERAAAGAAAAALRDGAVRSVAPASPGPTLQPIATLRALLHRVPDDRELVDAIGGALEAELGIRLAPAALSADEVRRVAEAERHYRSEDWTWRV